MLSASPLSPLLKVYVFGIISDMLKLAWGPLCHLPKNWVLGEHATRKFSFVCLRSMNSLPSYTKVFRSGQGVACALFMLCCSLLSYRWLSIYQTPTYPNLPQPNPPEPTPKLTTFFCTLTNLHFIVVSSKLIPTFSKLFPCLFKNFKFGWQVICILSRHHRTIW